MKSSVYPKPSVFRHSCVLSIVQPLATLLLGGLAWLTPLQTAANVINLFPSGYNIGSEADGEVGFSVGRDADLTAPVSFKFATADDTAKAGVDYVATNGVVTLGPGEDRKTIYVPLINNGRLDGNRGFQVRFSEPSAGASLVDTNVFITIRDDEQNGSIDPDFRPTVAITYRPHLGRFFVAPVPPGRPEDAGKVWIAGGPDGVAKLKADGSADRGFQLDDTLVGHRVEPLLALHDGTLLVIESVNDQLLRLFSDGRRDAGFASTPGVVLAVEQADGKIIVVVRHGSIARIGSDGLPDPTFKKTDLTTIWTCYNHVGIRALRLDSLGRVVVGGWFQDADGNDLNPVIRLQPDGVADPTFLPDLKQSHDGLVYFPHVSDLIVDQLDRIWFLTDYGFDPILGDFGPGGMFRLREDGSRDQGFLGPQGFVGYRGEGGLFTDGKDVLMIARRGCCGFGLDGVVEVKVDGSVKQVISGQSLFPAYAGVAPGECPPDSRAALASDEAGHIFVASAASLSTPYDRDDQAFYPGLVRLDRGAANRQQFQFAYPKYPVGLNYYQGFNGPFGFDEANPIARVRIFRTGDTGEAASVEYSTVDDTARAGRDYVGTSGRVDFAPLEVEREIDVPIRDNSDLDGDRQFRIALRGPSVGYKVPTVHAPFTIRDDDLGFAPGSVRRLGDGRIRLTLSNPADNQNYVLHASADLQHWTPLATNAVCCGQSLTFEDTSSPAALRYYRAIIP